MLCEYNSRSLRNLLRQADEISGRLSSQVLLVLRFEIGVLELVVTPLAVMTRVCWK